MWSPVTGGMDDVFCDWRVALACTSDTKRAAIRRLEVEITLGKREPVAYRSRTKEIHYSCLGWQVWLWHNLLLLFLSLATPWYVHYRLRVFWCSIV